jgi:aspartate/methionine/tyrosine aminotransferase
MRDGPIHCEAPVADYQVPARIRRLRIEDRQPLPGLSVVGAERRLDFLTSGDGLINATYADTRRFPPYPQVITDFVAAATAGGLSYTPYRGDPAVRYGLAEAVGAFLGVGVDPDLELLVTPGSQAGLFLAVGALVSDGDRVIVVDPDYLANERIVRFYGGIVDPVPLTWTDGAASLDEDALAAAAGRGPRLVMLSNPNNPTGGVYRREAIEQVAEAARRAGAYVLVDELYARLLYDGRRIDHLIAQDGMRERCVTLVGPSKTESMSGYRVGAAVGPPAVIEAMEDLLSVSALRAPAYAQRAMSSWLRDDHDFVAARVREYQQLRDLTVGALRRISGVSVEPAGGTAYLFPRVGDGSVGDQRIAEALLNEAGVIVNPGYQFGAAGQGHFRLCFAQDETAWRPALDRIGTALRGVLASAALRGGPYEAAQSPVTSADSATRPM